MTNTQLFIALTSLPVTYCIGIWFKNFTIKTLRKVLERKNIIILNDGECIRAMEKEIELQNVRIEVLHYGISKLEDNFKSARIRRRNNFWRKNRKNAVR
jgi:hypothetical protein